MIKVALKGTTIPRYHRQVRRRCCAAQARRSRYRRYRRRPPLRALVETVGIKDIRSKALRSNNPCNVVRATIDGLSKLRNVDEVAAIRGKSAKQILG